MEGRGVAHPQKKWLKQKRTILFVDEASFYLLPHVVRTWAPRGERPLLKWQAGWNHVSAAAAVSQEGKMWTRMQEGEGSFSSTDVIAFLEQLLGSIKGKIGIVWDGVSTHRSLEIHQFLVGGGAKRIELVRLPAYSPDLNPVEGVWSYLKRVELKNFACHDLPQLRNLLMYAFRTLRSKPHIVKACFQQPHCYD